MTKQLIFLPMWCYILNEIYTSKTELIGSQISVKLGVTYSHVHKLIRILIDADIIYKTATRKRQYLLLTKNGLSLAKNCNYIIDQIQTNEKLEK